MVRTLSFSLGLFLVQPMAAVHNQTGNDFQALIDHYPTSYFVNSTFFNQKFGSSVAIRVPAFVNRFDWHLGDLEHRRASDPKTVFLDPAHFKNRDGKNAVEILISSATQDWNPSHRNRTLLIANTDLWTSGLFEGTNEGGSSTTLVGYLGKTKKQRALAMHTLKNFFGTVFMENKDVKTDGVEVFPMSLAEHYLRRHNVSRVRAAISSARTDWTAKPKIVLAAWGAAWPMKRHPLGYGSLAFKYHSRQSAYQWARSLVARKAGVETRTTAGRNSINWEEWWTTLASYRFLICPTGFGIQTPKQIEALLVLTIPIFRRDNWTAFDELADLGFPIVVVDSWWEITSAKLDHWWLSLSPQLESFRDTCLTTDAYWDLITGSNPSSCWNLRWRPHGSQAVFESGDFEHPLYLSRRKSNGEEEEEEIVVKKILPLGKTMQDTHSEDVWLIRAGPSKSDLLIKQVVMANEGGNQHFFVPGGFSDRWSERVEV